MNNPIKFGTDGWRGIIGEDFTFDSVRACTQGVADYMKQANLSSRGILIGYDNRFLSEHFAAASAEVLAANGIKTLLCSKATPTPVISFGVTRKKLGLGIIITASHNQAIYNGFKIKSEHGYSAPDEVTSQVEALIAQASATGRINRMPLSDALSRGLVEQVDLTPAYSEQLNKLVNLNDIRQAGLKVVLDPMYGAGIGYLRRELEGGTIRLLEINGERNPLFPGMTRPEPIAVNLTKLSTTVKEQGADVGLATDGDADRMGIIDEKGNFLTQLQVFALLCLYLLEVRGERGAIVKTLTTTRMAHRLGEIFNVPVYETAVGFKYVAPLMMEQNALIGGEESGGYGFRGHVPERDGILANLFFLDLMVKTGKTPSQLVDYLYGKVLPHHYERQDITFPENERQSIINRVRQNSPESIDRIPVANSDTIDGFRFILVDGSWLLIRFSGTEPVLRIYAEADSPSRAKRMVEVGRKLAGV